MQLISSGVKKKGANYVPKAKVYKIKITLYNDRNFNSSFIKRARALIFNRPGVAVAVLQAPLSLIHSLTKSSFSSKYSEHLHSQAVRARKLTF